MKATLRNIFSPLTLILGLNGFFYANPGIRQKSEKFLVIPAGCHSSRRWKSRRWINCGWVLWAGN